jgi:hypothetical protein
MPNNRIKSFSYSTYSSMQKISCGAKNGMTTKLKKNVPRKFLQTVAF